MLLCNINVILPGLVEPHSLSEYLRSGALIGMSHLVRY
jgi:hypothetical protein